MKPRFKFHPDFVTCFGSDKTLAKALNFSDRCISTTTSIEVSYNSIALRKTFGQFYSGKISDQSSCEQLKEYALNLIRTYEYMA